MMPSCDQIGVPIHFHSSTTSGSASLMSLRILLRVSPRQSPSSTILFEMSSDADWPWLAPDFSCSHPGSSGDISFARQWRIVVSHCESARNLRIPAQHRESKGSAGELKRRRVNESRGE